MTGSQRHSATRGLAVARLDDLGRFPDCPVPDSRVGVGEGPFGGVEPGGGRGPPLDGDGGAPALVEVADGEDAVLVAGLGEGVLDVLEELGPPGRRDRGDRLAQSADIIGRRLPGPGRAIRGLGGALWSAGSARRPRFRRTTA